MHESFFVARMAPFIQQFHLRFPEVNFKMETGYHHDVIDDVVQHVVDFGFVHRNPERNEIEFHPMLQEELIFIASEEIINNFQTSGFKALNREPG